MEGVDILEILCDNCGSYKFDKIRCQTCGAPVCLVCGYCDCDPYKYFKDG